MVGCAGFTCVIKEWVAAHAPSWYARIVIPIPVLGDGTTGPWFRVQSIVAPGRSGTAGSDFLAVLPAASLAARRGRAFVVGWLCRAAGAPLELITNAVFPGPEVADGTAEPGALIFPPGARGGPAAPGWLAACEQLVWAPCPGRQALPLLGEPSPAADHETRQPGRFESALAVARSWPFGWLVVAEPTGLLDQEVAAFREAGLWLVRVLVGAGSTAELARIAPVLVGSADLGHHPYRLGMCLDPQP